MPLYGDDAIKSGSLFSIILKNCLIKHFWKRHSPSKIIPHMVINKSESALLINILALNSFSGELVHVTNPWASFMVLPAALPWDTLGLFRAMHPRRCFCSLGQGPSSHCSSCTIFVFASWPFIMTMFIQTEKLKPFTANTHTHYLGSVIPAVPALWPTYLFIPLSTH